MTGQTDVVAAGFAGCSEAELVSPENYQKAETLFLGACKLYKEAVALAPTGMYRRTAMGSYMSLIIVFPSITFPGFSWDEHFPTLEELRQDWKEYV